MHWALSAADVVGTLKPMPDAVDSTLLHFGRFDGDTRHPNAAWCWQTTSLTPSSPPPEEKTSMASLREAQTCDSHAPMHSGAMLTTMESRPEGLAQAASVGAASRVA